MKREDNNYLLKDKNILIVDDSKFNIKVLTDILKSQPYNIFAVNKGKKALEFVKREKVDLILLDVLMPDLDGLEVCQKLKLNPKSKDIPIIFISILDKSKDIVKGFKAGAVDYIVKPFQKEVVLARINTHLKLNEAQKKLQKRNKELKKLLNEVEYLSFHDKMTGLFNRRYFETELERLDSSRKMPITILVIDLDRLKNINDNYGHKIGDQYIRTAAEVLKNSSRGEDIVARIGGDEFAFLLPETDSETAVKIYQRIEEKTKEYNQDHELIEKLQMSIGFAVKKGNEKNLDQTFKEADQMMYNNKKRN